ncbi:katanin p80 WD40 repeat-containing subunit B1 homolog KTN80.4 isoform X1 [Elaeis guineensis]|uniref:Katanin p80 WD40 repeat-containing subunit B1 homolog n=1 Tax=Elaeis guineensis var. tenera TaxID=51953 RepID=A0A6I9QA89_ELAGV|nr:katanin p80 WD40 repeat-containing subunit B1 homolog isoform X1 [Elaeis guineensis]
MAKRGYKLQEFVAHTSDVNCLNIGKKSSRVFVTGGDDRKVNLWAIGKPTPLLSLCGHTSAVESVAFDSAEVLVLAGSSNGSIKLWDLEEAKIVRTLSGHRFNCTSVEFHPFGEFFASGSSDTDLKIWDIRKKGCIHTYKGHTRGIRTIKFTPDGRWVVTGGEDNVVKVWDLTAGKLLHDFKFHKGQIRCIDFHPHEFLLATGSADRTVKFWDLETFELIGSAGPEVTGVRSMIFHPDGRTLFCGLDVTLKVFSWEPIRCHDVVDMGWSTLGDLSIYEGKLLGCSYHESRVGVWVADISLIGPYAVGVVSKTYDLMEPVYSNGEDHSTKLMESNIKSSTALITGHHDFGGKPKESVLQGINSTYASSMASMNSTDVKRNKSAISHSTPQGFDRKSTSKASAVNSTTFRVVKATESPSNTLNRMESGFATRPISSCSTVMSMHNSLTLRKGSMMEANAVMDVQAIANPVSMPVVVPRDSLNQDTPGSSRKVIADTEATTQGSMLCKPTQMRKPSFLGGCSEGELIATVSGPLSGMSNNLGVLDPKLLSKTAVSQEAAEADEGNHRRTKSIAEKFEKIMLLEEPLQVYTDKNAEAPCSNSETNSVKYVRGVAVQLGRTRSLVESWEKRERFNSGYSATISSSSDPAHSNDTSASLLKAPEKTSERDVMSADDDFVPDILLQNHNVFINAVKSRLTKLQAVRHFWEQNGIKGAINAVVKLPDHSVQVDLISILKEKIDLFTLELFSCLLPLLVGLLNSRTERHLIVALEMLLELVKIFGPVIHSTMSASSLVGVDLQAEQRLERCSNCFNHLEKIKQMLPSLIRREGLLGRHAQELNLFLLDL